MKILLFGKNGQVGSALAPVLAARGEVIALGRDSLGGLSGDLSEPRRIVETIRRVTPDLVVNAAAYTTVDRAEEESTLAHTINAEAPTAMARACRESGALLVHYSTDYVFGGGGTRPWREDDPVAPVNAYGRAKLAGEEGVIASGCRQLIFRTSWVYSAGGNNFLKTMLRLSAERDKLQVIDDQWGAPTGATLIAEVTAKAIDVASGSAAMHGIYHLAPAGETTWYRYARFLIQRARNVGWPVIVSPDDIVPIGTEAFSTPAKRPLNSRLDCHRLEQSLGMRMPDWREGVAAVVDEIAATTAKRTSS